MQHIDGFIFSILNYQVDCELKTFYIADLYKLKNEILLCKSSEITYINFELLDFFHKLEDNIIVESDGLPSDKGIVYREISSGEVLYELPIKGKMTIQELFDSSIKSLDLFKLNNIRELPFDEKGLEILEKYIKTHKNSSVEKKIFQFYTLYLAKILEIGRQIYNGEEITENFSLDYFDDNLFNKRAFLARTISLLDPK